MLGTVIATTLAISGMVGLVLAVYFTLSYYLGSTSPFLERFARVCRTDHGTCTLVIRTPYARVLGLPNAVFGLGYYVGLMGVAGWWLARGEIPFPGPTLGVAWFTAAFSLFLVWSLLAKLKAP